MMVYIPGEPVKSFLVVGKYFVLRVAVALIVLLGLQRKVSHR